MNKIYNKILLITLFMLLAISSKAQMDYLAVDSNTYKLYYNQQWNRLIEYGDSAIESGIDYMFLRQRIGVAYFSLQNYRMASFHLEKALKFNSDDDFTLYYLYYSYLYSGRQSDANYITQNMTDAVKANIKWKNKYICSVNLESAYSISNNISKNSSINYAAPYAYGENTMCNNLTYFHLGLSHEVLPFLSFYHGFSKISIESEKIIYFPSSSGLKEADDKYSTNQYEYYISSNIQLKQGLKLSPAYHYLHVGFTNIVYDTAVHNVVNATTSINNYVASIAITKDFKITNLSVFASTSNLNSLHQLVFGTTLNYFPLGNLDAYTSTTLSCILEKNNINGTPMRFIFDQMAGIKLMDKLWGEASVTLGNLTDFNEKNAYVVYNTFDDIIFKTGVSLLYSLSPMIDLSLRYQYLSRQDTYYTSINAKQAKYTTTNYNNNTIIGGIKWKL